MGGTARVVSNCLDMFAFLPNPLLSVSADLLIADLRQQPEQQQGFNYLVKGNGVGGFHALENGEWRALYSSSFKHVPPGFSAYRNNAVESFWASSNVAESEFLKKKLCGDFPACGTTFP